MTGPLDRRVAIVTGAARGIGFAAAKTLLSRGAGVAAIDCDEAALAEARKTLGGAAERLSFHRCDVGDETAVGRATDEIVEAHGRIDILVNNAAIMDDTPLARLSGERLNEVMGVNFGGALNCVRACLPHLRKSPHASVINVASTQGLRGQPSTLAYAAAKSALISLSRSLAVDLGPDGIRVNAIAPGFIDTRMAIRRHDGQHEHRTEWFRDVYIKYGRLPLRRAGTPDEVAGPIVFLAGDDSRYMTGQVIVVDGGLTCTY